MAAPLVFAAQVGLDEAAGNVARYALRPSDPRPVMVSVTGRLEYLILMVEDEGPRLDPTSAPVSPRPPDTGRAEPGGHGLRLLRHYCPDLRYQRRNALTMRFRLHPASR